MCCAVSQSKARVSRQVYGAPDDLLSLPSLLLFCSNSHVHFRMAGSPLWGSKYGFSCVCYLRGAGCPAYCLCHCLLLVAVGICWACVNFYVYVCVCVCMPCCWILVSSPRPWHILSMSVCACCGRPCTSSWSVPGDVACIQPVWLCALKAV